MPMFGFVDGLKYVLMGGISQICSFIGFGIKAGTHKRFHGGRLHFYSAVAGSGVLWYTTPNYTGSGRDSDGDSKAPGNRKAEAQRESFRFPA